MLINVYTLHSGHKSVALDYNHKPIIAISKAMHELTNHPQGAAGGGLSRLKYLNEFISTSENTVLWKII